MKTSVTLVILAVLSLNAEADLRHLKSRNIVMPVNPRYTAQEWKEIYAAQKPSPEYYPNFKKGTEPQLAFAGKVDVPVNEQDHRITGGMNAIRAQFPWQVAIIIDSAYFCGGSLISSEWVLTAAHCMGSTYLLLLGATRLDISQNGTLYLESVTSIIHSQYDGNTANNDIAVIQLPSAVTFSSYISPVQLPPSNLGNFDYYDVTVSGWGKISDSASGITPVLQYVQLTVISNEECANIYGSVITSTKICTSTIGGKSTCSGDSGGPLLLMLGGVYNQVGIVSFGAVEGCELEYPVGFTRVTSYLNWIETNTGISLQL